MKLSIIILNYNTKDYTLQAINSIPKHTDWEILVVDNASTDDSVAAFEELGSQIVLIKNKENTGFAAGNNLGLKKAKGEFIMFLNSDTRVHDGAIETLLTFLETHPQVGIVTPKLIMEDGSLDWASHRGTPTPLNSLSYFTGLEKLFPNSKQLAQYHLKWKNLDTPHEVEVVSMAAMLMRREVYDQVGLLDEQFFMYAEDIDYCVRARSFGWLIYFVPDAIVTHYKGVSGTKNKQTKTRSTTRHHFYHTMKQYFAKHYGHYPRPALWAINQAIDTVKWIRK